MKKFSVTKNTPAMARKTIEPTRPTTPAPAAFLETASALLLIVSKKPDEFLSGWGSLIGWRSFVHPLHIARVIGDGGAHGLKQQRAADQRENEGADPAHAPAWPLEQRGVEQLRQPDQAALRVARKRRLAVLELVEDFLGRQDQARLVGARGQMRQQALLAQRVQVLDEV